MDETVPDRGPQLMALLWVMTGIATLMVILRFIARYQKSVVGGFDDIFMLIAMV